jgi:threonine dehydratase
MRPSLFEIRNAQQLLAKYFLPTPLQYAAALSTNGAEVFLKLEIGLPTGSFKPRGALYSLAANLSKRNIIEVTASSTGNHRAAVAWAAKTVGIAATIFLPANPNPVKLQKIVDLGARIVEAGGPDLVHAFLQAQEYSARPGVYFLNDATDADLPAGPATIGLEILAQLPPVAAIYVPMGDTASIRGIGAAIKPANHRSKSSACKPNARPPTICRGKRAWRSPRILAILAPTGLRRAHPNPKTSKPSARSWMMSSR